MLQFFGRRALNTGGELTRARWFRLGVACYPTLRSRRYNEHRLALRACRFDQMGDSTFIVYLVDDDTSVLKALSRLLYANGYDIQPFSSAQDFLDHDDPAIPGCAVLDVAMPDLDGLALQNALIARGDQRPIIFLTGKGDISTSVRAMKAGAVDFLTKPVTEALLLDAIHRAREADKSSRQLRVEVAAIQARIATLTPRQYEVLLHVIAGRLNKQIAGDMGTVEKTIKVHRGRVMEKLGVRTVADLVRLAEKAGISAWTKS